MCRPRHSSIIGPDRVSPLGRRPPPRTKVTRVTDRRETEMAEIKRADLLAKSLKEQGVEYMFGVVGFLVGPIAEDAQKVGLHYICLHNEHAASFAAGAVCFLTGRPWSFIV